MDKQGKLVSLDGLMRNGLAPDRGAGLLQKLFRKYGAESGYRTRHQMYPIHRKSTVFLPAQRLYDIFGNLDIIHEMEHLGCLAWMESLLNEATGEGGSLGSRAGVARPDEPHSQFSWGNSPSAR